MDISSILWGFIASYLPGSLPSLREFISTKDKTTLDERIEQCYQTALGRWCANDAVRQRIAQKHFNDLKQVKKLYLTEKWEKEGVILSSLANLWIEELSKDEEVSYYITTQGIILKDEKLDKLTASLTNQETRNGQRIRRGLTKHKAVDGYIRRFCTSDQSENNFIYYVLGKKERHTLADYVTGVEETSTNKIVLYSSAQTGKTTELKQLCWELQQSGLYLPVSFEVRTNTKLKRDDLPESQYVDGREVVLVIDALDEVNGQKYEDLLEEIGGYAYEHPEMKMVLSCRSNFRRERQLELFTELFLEELSIDDARDYAAKREVNSDRFMRSVFANQLEDFIKNPFFLSVLIDAYKGKGKQLPKTKADIYKLFIKSSYDKEVKEKNVSLSAQHSFEESVRLLERVALGLSLMNAQSLNKEELRICLQNDDNNVEECLRYDLIRDEGGQYSFAHNAFREWLVANYLNRYGIERAKQLATHPNGRIKPEWYNIIMLWLSMYGKDKKEEVSAILKWLKKASLDLIIYIDRDMLDYETRNEVFKGLLLEYKSLGIRMSNIMTHDYEDLWRFAYSTDTVGFVVDELSDTETGTTYYSDLMCLCYFLKWDSLKSDSADLTEKLFSVLEKKTAESLEKEDKYHDLSFLYFDNPFFTQQTYLERLFAIVKDSNHYDAIKSMIRLIGEADKADGYIDYILDKEGYVHNQHKGHTTHMVTRTPIYTTLAKVRSLQSVEKILTHTFYHSQYEYHDEQEEYSNMIKGVFGRASEFIKQGHTELIGIIEAYYKKAFKEYHRHFDNNRQTQELLMVIRDCYLTASLREKGRKTFYERQAELFAPKEESSKWEDIRQAYIMAALWMTAEDVKDDFKKFAVDNSTDWAKASWYQEIPYAEVAECAEMLYKEKFPQPEIITKGRERRQQAFMDFTEYPVFKQIVLEMVTGLDNHSSRKEFYKKLRDQDEGYNQYAFSFLLLFVDDNNYYNIGEIVKGVKNMDIYESFFMKEVSGMMDRSDMDVSVTEEIKIRVVKWAKASVLKLSDGEPIFFWREALGLMLKGEFEIPSEKLLSLLCFGSYTISRKDFDEYYSREYSLFEYITERVDSVTLAPKVIEKLRANIDNAEYPLLYSFSNYIIENQIEEGYSLVLCFALSGYSLSANVMETLVKKGMKIEEIKKAASGLKVSDRLFCYSTLIRNTQESVWVRERLEGEYKSFNGYDLEHAVRLLISIGSMDALDYLVTRPEMIKYRDDYHFNYDNPNAISSLCYFIRYCYEHKIDGHFMLNSILNSLERIAIKSKDVLMEVTQYLRQLTQRGEMYKYLNRYIIGFEDKYYAAYSGISDINEAMRIADGGRLTKTEEEKAEEIPWREDEGIYISYNWEGHSAHIVDYLGFVLENRGIPFKLDKKDCPYTVNIKEFMNAIRAGKTVIVVLSRPYLRSKNCMYELSGIMENVNYKDRMLPVVVDDTIRDDDFYVELVKHWKEKKDKQTEIVEKLRDLDPDMAEPEEMKLKEIEQVYGLLKVIKEYIDWANADNLDALSSSRFKKIIDEIYKRRGIEHEDISG